MPIALFEMPDGRVAQFEVPEGTTPEQAQLMMEQAIASGATQGAGRSPPRPGIINEMKRGAKSLLSDTISGLGIAGGQESARKAATEGLARSEQIAKEHGETPWERVKKVYNDPKGGLLSAVGEGVSQMPAAIAAQAPQLAVTAGAAKLGAMGGGALAGPPGALVGGALAAGASMFPQFTGGAMQTQAQEDMRAKRPVDIDIPAALAAAAGSTALEVGGGALALGRSAISSILKIPAKTVAEQSARAGAKLAVEAKRSLLGAGARGVGRGLAVEMPVEVAQKVLDRAQAGLSLVDDEAMAEYGDTLGATAMVAPALGGAGRIHSRSSARAQVEEQEKAARDAAELAAEQQAAAAEQQKEVQRKDPAYAAQVAQTYRDTEAKYKAMLPGKLAKGADEATKVEHAAQAKLAKEFLESTLKPQIAEYLAVKPVLQAQQAQQQATTPQPGTPEEETGLLFPLAQTDLQPPGPAIPTADEVEQQRQQLADQAQALDVHVESLRDQAAKAETPEDSLRINKLFTQAQAARAQAQQQIDELPKAPKNVDLAKQLENANKAWLKAKEEGDPEAAARAALRIQKAKAAGADLMQPGPGMEMVPAGGKSESQEEFFPKVATDTLAPKPLQIPFDATKVAVPDRGQGPARLPYDPGTDIRSMEANRLDTSKTAQPDLLAGVEQRQQTVNDAEVETTRPEVAPGTVEMATKVQTGVGDVSTKSRAQLLSYLQIARAAGNKAAATEAIEGLRDLKARGDAEKAARGSDASSVAGSQLAATMGSRMPGNVAKQQAARDALYRAYGSFVSLLNRFSKGLAKKEELDTARKQILDNLVDDIGTTRGLPLTAPEAQEVQSQAKQRINELQTRFGDTRDVIDVGTKDMPEYAPVQERDGTFIRDRIDRPQGTANLESRRPGRRTFDSPHAAAQAILEEIEQIRNNAINGTPGVPGVVGKQTKTVTSPEDLDAAIAKAKDSPLLERLKDNLPAFAADPDRRNLAAEWLYKESIGQKNDVGAEVAAELDRLEAGKRSDEVVQDDLAPDAELQGTVFATKEEFEAYLAGDALKEMRNAAGPVLDTMARIRRQTAPLERRVAELQANIAALQTRRAGIQTKGVVQAADAEKRVAAAQAKLDKLLEAAETKLEPLRAEARDAQRALRDVHQTIADIEQRIAVNHDAFFAKYDNSGYVKGALDTLQRAREKHIALINDPDVVANIQQGVFLRPDVIAAGKRANDALVDAIQALQKEPSSRAVLSFLNKDLELQLELQGAQEQLKTAQGTVRQTEMFLEMGNKVFADNIRKSPEGDAVQRELGVARKNADNVVQRQAAKLRDTSKAILALGEELDAATKELSAAVKPALARAADRAKPRVGEDLQAKANAEQRAENDRLERMAEIPGEQVSFTDLAAVADKFAELPEKVARLEAKATDEALPATTRAKAKNGAKKYRERMETLYGLLSDDPQAVAAAQTAAQKQLDDVKERIGAKQKAVNEDGVTDKTRLSRTAELYDLRSELRDLQKFVDGFGKKVKRTPIETRAARSVRLGDQRVEEGTRLRASRQGPLMKKETVAGNVRTGDLTTVGERTLSPRNPIVQSGKPRSPTSTQVQRAAAQDTAYEAAMLKLGKIEDLKERNDAALERAQETNDPRLQKYQEFDVRLQAALVAQQKVVDATVTGKRKAKAVTDVEVDAVTDEPAEARNLDTARAERVKLTATEQERKFGQVVYHPAVATGPGMTTDAVDAAVAKTTEGWTNTPETVVVATEAELPQRIQDQAARDGMTGKIPGLFDPDTGKVYLVAENLHSPKDVALTVVHEVAGHYGLRDMMGADYAPTMNRLYNGNENIKAAADAKMQASPNLSREVAVEETLAEMAETQPARGSLTKDLVRAYYAIKSWLAKKLGLRNVTDGEVRQIVANARRHVKRGTPNGNGPQSGQAVYRTAYASDDIFAKKKTMKERLQGNAALAFEQGAVDMRASLAKTLKTGSSKLAAQAMYYVRKNDHMMSNTYAVMQHGALGIKVDARGNRIIEAGHSKSVQDVFKAIGKIPGANDADRMQKAQIYLTANRVANDPMAAQALDLNGAAVAKLQADLAKFKADPDTMKALEHVRDVYADLNRGMLQFLVDTGAMKKAEAARLTASNSYVPFYRVRGDGVAELVFDENRTIRLGDIRTQPYLKELKGGTAKLLPLNEAVTRNVMLLTSMGMRNQTTRNVAYALQEIGRAASTKHKPMQIVPGDGGADAGVMRFKQDGDDYHILVDTTGTAAEGIPADLLARSIEGTHLVVPSIVKGFSWFSDVLRSGVTRNPMYVARQLFRDPFAASFTGGLDRGPLTAVAKSIAAYVHQTASGPSKTAQDLIRKGLVQSQIFSGGPEDLAKISLQLAGGDQGAFDKLFSAMDRAAMRADAVTREQVYDDVLARTGSEMEAEVAASEMMDFQKRGSSATVQYAARMIPFFNAQIQGLNVLVKAARGTASMQERLDIQNKFFERAMLLAAGTLVYAAAMEDDDAYKNARPSDRYGYWFVPIPGMKEPLKLPIPFEVGVLFKVLPEAIMDMMNGKFDAQEMKAIRGLMLNQIPGFSSAGQAQAIKPIIEVATNHSFFTGREIEGAGMQRLDPQERYTARTTELVKRMSEAMPDAVQLSPVQIEHLTRGFFGSLPLMGAALVNEVFAKDTAVDRPTTKLSETPLFGGLFQDVNGGGPTDALYAKIRAADQAKATYDKMLREGRKQDAKMYMADVENLRALPMLQQAETRLQQLSAQEKIVRNNTSASAERKREMLDNLAAKRESESRKFLTAISAVSR